VSQMEQLALPICAAHHDTIIVTAWGQPCERCRTEHQSPAAAEAPDQRQ